MTAKKETHSLTQYNVPYLFGTAQFHALVNAVDAEEAKAKALAAFKKDAYPMDKITILGAMPHALVEGKIE